MLELTAWQDGQMIFNHRAPKEIQLTEKQLPLIEAATQLNVVYIPETFYVLGKGTREVLRGTDIAQMFSEVHGATNQVYGWPDAVQWVKAMNGQEFNNFWIMRLQDGEFELVQ